MSGWSDDQVRTFAKQIARKYQAAWFVLTPEIREAVVSESVLMLVLGQDKGAVKVEEVRALRIAICLRLEAHHRMPTDAVEWLWR